MKKVAHVTIFRSGEVGTRVQVILESNPDGRPTLTYSAHGWLKPMTQGEFSSMLVKEGLLMYPKNPKFKIVKDEV